ncbi:uncharacterized protein TRUGW13939_10180 [Talaromyces rugulosus]|uniref:Uncharacterized protein n=1 Tax=Talaromyces rugulosus TaxID=121627 RepID=A0A7H8R9I1_TALRU|nr:uncharacterized protein TRUGW13939_10180 [Talaromyces rugulosus]QKX63012.1 hypothetical protein TRUGW13939_10180 [Talaromyces rugulosus]
MRSKHQTILIEELIQWYRENGEYCKRPFKKTLVHELKENGILMYSESLDEWELWHHFEWELEADEDDEDDDPRYYVDSDHECPPDDEDLRREYAGEEYFDYLEYPDD